MIRCWMFELLAAYESALRVEADEGYEDCVAAGD